MSSMREREMRRSSFKNEPKQPPRSYLVSLRLSTQSDDNDITRPGSLRSSNSSLFGNMDLRHKVTYGNAKNHRTRSSENDLTKKYPTPVDGSQRTLESLDNCSRVSVFGSGRDSGKKVKLRRTESKKPSIFSRDFEVLSYLGAGGYSKVYSVRQRKTGKIFAAKVMETNLSTPEQANRSECRLVPLPDIMNEVQIMESVRCSCVVQFERVLFEDGLAIVVMDLAEGRDLYSTLRELGRTLQEWEAAALLVDIFSALALLHSRGIVHRDVKPENFIFKKADAFVTRPGDRDGEVYFNEHNALLLADFGLSWACYIDHFPRHRFCGSALYMASEVVEAQGNEEKLRKRLRCLSTDSPQSPILPSIQTMRNVSIRAVADSPSEPQAIAPAGYGPPMDMWAAGVLLYEVVSGSSPFLEKTTEATLRSILTKRLPLISSKSQRFSPELADLINRLVTRDPSARITACKALSHKWLQKMAPMRLKQRLHELHHLGVHEIVLDTSLTTPSLPRLVGPAVVEPL